MNSRNTRKFTAIAWCRLRFPKIQALASGLTASAINTSDTWTAKAATLQRNAFPSWTSKLFVLGEREDREMDDFDANKRLHLHRFGFCWAPRGPRGRKRTTSGSSTSTEDEEEEGESDLD